MGRSFYVCRLSGGEFCVVRRGAAGAPDGPAQHPPTCRCRPGPLARSPFAPSRRPCSSTPSIPPIRPVGGLAERFPSTRGVTGAIQHPSWLPLPHRRRGARAPWPMPIPMPITHQEGQWAHRLHGDETGRHALPGAFTGAYGLLDLAGGNRRTGLRSVAIVVGRGGDAADREQVDCLIDRLSPDGEIGGREVGQQRAAARVHGPTNHQCQHDVGGLEQPLR
mgnify:CR=1 FL=1